MVTFSCCPCYLFGSVHVRQPFPGSITFALIVLLCYLFSALSLYAKVSIDLNGSPLCGGIIVTSRHVFTAAHCVTDKNGGPDAEPGDVQVRVGTVVVTQGDVYNVSRILVHPKFQKAGRHFAIQVLTVSVDCKTKYGSAAVILLLCCMYSLWRKFNCVKIPKSEANKIRESLGKFWRQRWSSTNFSLYPALNVFGSNTLHPTRLAAYFYS